MTTYVIRIRLRNGMLTEMAFEGHSYAEARGKAEAFGTVLGMISSS